MILIVSSVEDDHAAAVLKELKAQSVVEVQLLDLSRFPQELQLSMDFGGAVESGGGRFRTEKEEIPVSDATVVWWRRPQPFTIPEDISDRTHLNFAFSECYEAVNGLWLTLSATWVNNPGRDEEAARKPYQLQLASELGFTIPRTRITSDPAAAREFVEALQPTQTIYKAFTGTEQAWRETRVLRGDEIDLLDDVRFAPVIFQEYIAAKLDLRITVIGSEIYASAIHSAEVEYQADYRMELSNARVEPFTLPKEVEGLVRTYMERLGLVYGAIDMRVTPEGRYVFLEINPAGQWLFMEERTGVPMTEAFAKLLLREHEARTRARSGLKLRSA